MSWNGANLTWFANERPPMFNDYNDSGYRINKYGCRSHKAEDNAIVNNLRYKFKQDLIPYGDATIVNWYDDFFWAFADCHLDDDNFIDWLKGMGEIE